MWYTMKYYIVNDNQQISVKQGWISQIEPEVNAYIAYNFTYIKFEMNKSNWH